MIRANISMTAKKYASLIESKSVRFDNVYQRGVVWSIPRCSLLIHSIMYDYPVPPLYAIEADGVYDILDGQQRSLAIYAFKNNEYTLKNVEPVRYTDNDGTMNKLDINGMRFNDLPEILQERIDDYSLDIVCFKNITQEEVKEMFRRLNNGVALNAVERTKVEFEIDDITTIKEIAKHPIFDVVFRKHERRKRTEDEFTIRTWLKLFHKSDSYLGNYKGIANQIKITDKQQNDILSIYDKMFEVFKVLKITNSKNIAVIRNKWNFLAYINFIDELDIADFAAWLDYFFDNITESQREYIKLSRRNKVNMQDLIDSMEISIKKYKSVQK